MVESSEKKLPQPGQYPEKLQHVGTVEVWTEIKQLSDKFACTSLGEGAPNLLPPAYLREAMADAMCDPASNQYCRSFGHPVFVNAIAKEYGKLYFDEFLGRPLDAMKEVLVSHGANTLLNVFCAALLNAGDECVSFEPHFPTYLDHIEMAGGKPQFCPLRYDKEAKIWKYDINELRAALGREKCKLFIFNSPHNPTGKVFTLEEITEIGEMIEKEFPHIVVISDEVYDFLTFDGRKHIPFASVGNNWERTVSLYSGGKLFSATGWKLGWAIGPAPIIHMGAIISNTVFYTGNTPGQIAMGKTLHKAFEAYTDMGHEGMTYAETVSADFAKNRDFITEALANPDTYPMEPCVVEGGYFFMADISKCKDLIPAKYFENHDYLPEDQRVGVNRVNMPDGTVPLDLAFCRWMACEKKLAIMPNSFFYGKQSPGAATNTGFVRMAICKSHESVKAGAAMFVAK